MSELLQKKWATFTHVHELKLGGKYEPIMSHVREWTRERGVHVHVCTSLIRALYVYQILKFWPKLYKIS